MGTGSPNTREPKVRSFHLALVHYLTSRGRMGEVHDISTWNRLVLSCPGLTGMSRQSVQDVTFVMEALGLIKRHKRQGVQVLPIEEPWQSQTHTLPVAVPA